MESRVQAKPIHAKANAQSDRTSWDGYFDGMGARLFKQEARNIDTQSMPCAGTGRNSKLSPRDQQISATTCGFNVGTGCGVSEVLHSLIVSQPP